MALGTFAQSNSTTYADTSTSLWDVKFCGANSAIVGAAETCAAAASVGGGGGAGTGYDYVSYLRLDPAEVPGPAGTPNEPFFDLATTSWDDSLQVNNDAAVGAIVGEIDFTLESNAPGSIPPGGAPTACGSTATAIGGNGSTYSAVRSPTTLPDMANPDIFDAGGSYVQSFDDDDGDLVEYVLGVDGNDPGSTGFAFEVAESQEDGVDKNDDGDFTDAGEIAPNGIIDGAERMPDFLPRLYSAAGISPLVAAGDSGRGYAVADVLAGVSRIDVNFIILDLNTIGVDGYVSITTIGIVDPNNIYNPAVAGVSGLQTCTPFRSATTTFGITRDNPDTGASEGGVLIREITPAAGSINYAITVSTIEDYDADGVSGGGIDRCQTDAAAGLDDGDGDAVSGTCDNNVGSLDNCDGGGPAAACPRADAPVVSEGTASGALCVGSDAALTIPATTAYPFNMDQDVDCDGAGNWADNCPTTYNPTQKDQDGDGVGNACDDNLMDVGGVPENACSGDSTLAGAFKYNPCWARSQGHDHDGQCNDPVTIGVLETSSASGTLLADTPPFGDADPCNLSQDSSDDGVLDLNGTAAFPSCTPTCGVGHTDINSDSDFDGCPDADEVDGDAECNGNPYDADDNDDSIIDGAENRGGSALADWRDSVANEPHTASNVFNNNGSPDSDGDGCSNRRESLAVDASGGNRDALNPYDFLDVPTPANGPVGADGKITLGAGSARNKAVALTDVGVILGYVGRLSGSGTGAPYYNADANNDGLIDGRQLDRSGGAGNAETAGNGAIALTDVGVALDHVGDSCTGTP